MQYQQPAVQKKKTCCQIETLSSLLLCMMHMVMFLRGSTLLQPISTQYFSLFRDMYFGPLLLMNDIPFSVVKFCSYIPILWYKYFINFPLSYCIFLFKTFWIVSILLWQTDIPLYRVPTILDFFSSLLWVMILLCPLNQTIRRWLVAAYVLFHKCSFQLDHPYIRHQLQ